MKTPRPKEIKSTTSRVELTCGKLYITIGEENDKPYEIFAKLGKAGSCTTCFLETVTLVVSLAMRWGIPIDDIIKKLTGIRCPSPSFDNGINYLSCVDAIGQILKKKNEELDKKVS
jgi:ribonucleoside-diphosphate reductase alpha chain